LLLDYFFSRSKARKLELFRALNPESQPKTKKLYYLTFIGTVTHIASTLYWQTMKLTDSQIEERWKQFDENEQDEIIEFLCRQGKLLNYPLFEESKWLAEQYTRIARMFAIIAHLICAHPPQPYKNLLLAAAIGKNQHMLIGGREDEEKIPNKQELIELLQDAYRREYTRLFFESIVFMKHNGKATTNLSLRRLAEEELKEQIHEKAGLELAIKLFGRKTKQK
jgi:hypothetical protein